MKCFDNETGCLTDMALDALLTGTLTERERLECAEHLAFCDKCLDRYNEILNCIPLEEGGVIDASDVICECRAYAVRMAVGRCAAAAAAFILAAGMWSFGVFDVLLGTTRSILEVELRPMEENEQTVLQRLDEFVSSVLDKKGDTPHEITRSE